MPPISAVMSRFRFGSLLVREDARLNLLLAAVVAVYAAVVYLVAYGAGLQAHANYSLYSSAAQSVAGLSLVIFVIGYVGHLALVRRVPRPVRVIYSDVTGLLRDPVVLLNGLWPLLIIPIFMSSFTSFKSMIPVLHPFSFDPLFADLDQMLHGGVAPWELTHAMFGSPFATVAINAAYNLWFFVMWVFLFLQIVRVYAHQERVRFILAFVLCWLVIGSLFAFLLSSAGPCYFGRVVLGVADPFAPMMTRLEVIDQGFTATGSYFGVWALDTQNLLWDMARSSETHVGSGISAMPSMHVSVATLLALSAFRIRRWFGWIMAGYAVMIQIGSVHLGWHYALDGYLSAVLTVIIWWLAGRVVRSVA
ncbi:phosphatase PAP2 family protein [Govanella unica]|uniref:Phosphatase PAP2 family protein n=1 Tax=Govanella unica TaxID=2975056 RepID=A0A9X3TYC2_9PROT|nr:phosphatase PAP2 family protein [Govania unica]MDA5193627.1 phosphatase PAP2 family protein [Govania unica]